LGVFLARPLAFLAVLVQRGERLCPLEVVPSCPAVNGFSILVALAAGVRDEALFGDVEFAAEAPELRFTKVGRLPPTAVTVLWRYGDWADVLSIVFSPL
jgi:hypothetical protein